MFEQKIKIFTILYVYKIYGKKQICIFISSVQEMFCEKLQNLPYLPFILNLIFIIQIFTVLHSSKKVTQHDFDRLYFYYLGFLFIKLDIPRKLVYLPFH